MEILLLFLVGLMIALPLVWACFGFWCYLDVVAGYAKDVTWPKSTPLKSVVAMVGYGPASWVVVVIRWTKKRMSKWINS